MNNAFTHFIPEQAHYTSPDYIPFTSFSMGMVNTLSIVPDVYTIGFNPKRIDLLTGQLAPPQVVNLGQSLLFHFSYKNCEY